MTIELPEDSLEEFLFCYGQHKYQEYLEKNNDLQSSVPTDTGTMCRLWKKSLSLLLNTWQFSFMAKINSLKWEKKLRKRHCEDFIDICIGFLIRELAQSGKSIAEIELSIQSVVIGFWLIFHDWLDTDNPSSLIHSMQRVVNRMEDIMKSSIQKTFS